MTAQNQHIVLLARSLLQDGGKDLPEASISLKPDLYEDGERRMA